MDHQYFNPGKKQYSKFHEMNYSTLTAHRREIDLPILSKKHLFPVVIPSWNLFFISWSPFLTQLQRIKVRAIKFFILKLEILDLNFKLKANGAKLRTNVTS